MDLKSHWLASYSAKKLPMKDIVKSVFLIFVAQSCAVVPTRHNGQDKFQQISFSSSKEDVANVYGPLDERFLKDPILGFVRMTYPSADGSEISFTFDESGTRLISKSKHFEPKFARKNLLENLKLIFGNPSFVRYVPCHTWANDEQLLIDEENGYFAASARTGPITVAWETSELIDYRIKHLYTNCPNLQPARVKN